MTLDDKLSFANDFTGTTRHSCRFTPNNISRTPAFLTKRAKKEALVQSHVILWRLHYITLHTWSPHQPQSVRYAL